MTEKFLTSSAVYKSYIDDDENGMAVYNEYILTSILVREKTIALAEKVVTHEYSLYFFKDKSSCTLNGEEKELPPLGENDICTVNGKQLRPSTKTTYDNGTHKTAHTKMILK